MMVKDLYLKIIIRADLLLKITSKQNICDIELVIIDHPKTVTKLSKPKIITQ